MRFCAAYRWRKSAIPICCLVGILVNGAPPLSAADVARGEFGAARSNETAQPGEKPKKAPNERGYPFHGTVASVDSAKGTVTLAGKARNRPFVVTSITKITKDGRRASLADIAAGDEIGGMAVKNLEGREEAKSLRIGKAKSAASNPRKATE